MSDKPRGTFVPCLDPGRHIRLAYQIIYFSAGQVERHTSERICRSKRWTMLQNASQRLECKTLIFANPLSPTLFMPPRILFFPSDCVVLFSLVTTEVHRGR